jgi:hypothetical protein
MERKSDGELMRGIPPRTWAALSADEWRVVATGETYQEAVAGAHDKGEDDPVVSIAPEHDGLRLFYT